MDTVWTDQDYIDQRLMKQIEYHSQAASNNKKRYERIQIAIIVLTALTPLCALFSQFVITPYIITVLASSQLTLAGICRLKKYHELWIAYRGIAEALKRERALFLTRTSHYALDNPLQTLAEHVETILMDTTANWSEIASKRDDASSTIADA